jgi:glycosyltransferase involved in cell wall biosynthesis
MILTSKLTDKTKMSDNPFFSVIVPVYNKEKYVHRAVSSILNQSYKDFELIIVCDPSTDNSNAEVEKFTDPRIRVFHRDKPGPGGYAARNLGIENSKGQWISFLDADDVWYSSHLDETRKNIEKKL